MNENSTKLPIAFWVIGVLALLWNLAGLANFGMTSFTDPTMMEGMTEAQIELMQSTPMWMKIVFGVATIGGTLGSIGLLMKKAWAVPAFLISMVAVVIQMGYSSFAMNALEIMDQSPILPVIVVLVAVLLWYYANNTKGKGWLN